MSKLVSAVFLAILSCSTAAYGADGLILKTVIDIKSIPIGMPLVSGDTIVTSGSNFSSNQMTRIWRADAAGQWGLTATLPHAGPAALSGDTLLLADQAAGLFTENPARIYTKLSSGAWSETATLTDGTANACDFFGASAALEDDTAAVGAVSYGSPPPSPWCKSGTGGVFVYTRGGSGTWAETQVLTPPLVTDGSIHQFGAAVVLSHGTLFVEADDDLTPVSVPGGIIENTNSLVYEYRRDASGTWRLMGTTVVGSHALSAFAATTEWLVSQTGQDSVSISTPSSGSWHVSQTLTSPPTDTGSFGSRFAVAGTLLALISDMKFQACPGGCPSSPPPPPGELDVYGLQAGKWQPIDLYAAGDVQTTLFEDSVDTDGTTVVADGTVTDTDGTTHSGIAVMQKGPVPDGDVPVATNGSVTINSSGGGGGGFSLLSALLLLGVGLARRRR